MFHRDSSCALLGSSEWRSSSSRKIEKPEPPFKTAHELTSIAAIHYQQYLCRKGKKEEGTKGIIFISPLHNSIGNYGNLCCQANSVVRTESSSSCVPAVFVGNRLPLSQQVIPATARSCSLFFYHLLCLLSIKIQLMCCG